MSLLQARGLGHSAGTEQLFENLNFSFAQDSHVGLVGLNGTGKSTLLKILSGEIQPDKGELVKRRGLNLQYIPQFFPKKLEDLSLMDMIHEHARNEGQHLEDWQVEVALSNVGFRESHFNARCGRLSGGEANRALLARSLALDPDFLLLDEPTNHLDTEGIFRFQGLLAGLRLPFCIVSHDRELLDILTDETLFLRSDKAHHFRAPYTQARLELLKLDESARRSRDQDLRKLAQLEAAKKRMQLWAKVSAKNAPRYHAMITRVERQKENLTEVHIEKRSSIKAGAQLVDTKRIVGAINHDVTIPTGRVLYQVPEFVVKPGDRVAILGINGSGKTTFLQELVDAERNAADISNAIKFNPQVKLAYYDQELRELNDGETILNAVSRGVKISESEAVKELAIAGFTYQRVHSKVGELSGGQKARLMFLKIKLGAPNLIILDEPTNHIDVQGIEMLEQDLLDSNATIILVSHDRRFLQNVANRFFLINDSVLSEISDVQQYYDLLAQKRDSD